MSENAEHGQKKVTQKYKPQERQCGLQKTNVIGEGLQFMF